MPRLCLASVEEDPVAMETRCSLSAAPPGVQSRACEETSLGRIIPGGTTNLSACCVGLPRFIKTRTRKFALTVMYRKEAPVPVEGTCQKINAAKGACQKCIASDCLGYVEISVEDVLGGSLRINTTIGDTSGQLFKLILDIYHCHHKMTVKRHSCFYLVARCYLYRLIGSTSS